MISILSSEGRLLMDARQPIPPLPPPLPHASAQSPAKARPRWLPKTRSGQIYLIFLIVMTAVILYPALTSLYTALTTGTSFAWQQAQAQWQFRTTILLIWACLLLMVDGIILLNIAIHESGHLLAGWFVGYWLTQCKIGPLMLTRVPRGFQLRLTRAGLSRGYVSADPFDTRRFHLRRAIFWGGGPLMSLLWAVISIWLYALVWSTTCAGLSFEDCLAQGPNAWVTLGSLSLAFWLPWLLLVNLSIALLLMGTSLLPLSRQGLQNDALKLLRLLRRDPALDRDLLLSCLLCQLRRGVRPRDWPADLVKRLTAALQQYPADRATLIYAYSLALDLALIQQAGALLDRIAPLLKDAPPALVASIALESAFFEARHRGNLAAARAWQARVSAKANQPEDLLRPRAEAAIALLEGRLADAQASSRAGLAALARARATRLTSLQTEEDSLRAMLAEAQQRQAAPADTPDAPTQAYL
jgi:hypothetical protein